MAKKLTDKESQEYRELTDYIQEIYISYGYNKNDIEWKMITAQIKNMVKDGLRYSGILLTLNYMINDKQMNLIDDSENGSILNLVPYYYNQAKQEWLNEQRVLKSIQEFGFDDNIIKVKKVKRERKNIIDLEF